MPAARRVLGAATSLAWALGALTLGWLLWPSSLGGCTTLTIVSGHSMEPTYYTGDLVVSRCGPVDVGDVIVYTPPDVGGARVIHRVVGGDAAGGWTVQGDNNDFLDPWTPTAEDVLGSAVLHLPQVGRVAAILLSPLTWLSLLAGALAIVVWPGRSGQDDPDGDDPDRDNPDGDDPDRDDPDRDDPDRDDPDRDLPARDEVGRDLPVAPAPADLPTVSRPSATLRVVGLRALVRGLVAGLVLLPLATGAGMANAAALAVTAGSLTTIGAGHPCPGTMTATTPTTTGTSSSVEVTPPRACAGRRLRIALSSGTVLRQGTATAPASGAVTVALDGAYTPGTSVRIAATVAGWHLPTTWSYTPPVTPPPTAGPVTPGTPWTDIRALSWPTVVAGQKFCFDVTVSTTNTGGQEDWALDLAVGQRPFNGAVSGYQVLGADAAKVRFASSAPVGGVLTVVGAGSYKKLRSTDPALSFQVCHDSTPPPAYDPTLTYTVRQGPVTGGADRACVATSVSVVGTPVFYAGWRADVDLSSAIALAGSAGETFSGVDADAVYTIEVRPGGIYRVSGGSWDNYGLRDGMTRDVVLCAR